MGAIFCMEKFVQTKANHTMNLLFVFWKRVLERNAIIPVLLWRASQHTLPIAV